MPPRKLTKKQGRKATEKVVEEIMREPRQARLLEWTETRARKGGIRQIIGLRHGTHLTSLIEQQANSDLWDILYLLPANDVNGKIEDGFALSASDAKRTATMQIRSWLRRMGLVTA